MVKLKGRFFSREYKQEVLSFIFPPFLLTDACHAEVKVDAPTAILDHEAALQLKVVAKHDRAETYREGLRAVVASITMMEATTPALNPYSWLVLQERI